MFAAMAQWEREEIGARIKASIQIRAKLGKPTNGKSPYGYHWQDRKLVQHPVEGPIRKLAYELFLKHRRKGRVAREMNDSGYRTRAGCPWSDMAIGRILSDWSAEGLHRLNVYRRTGAWTNEIKDESEWVSVECEPLVTEAVWNQANQIIEEQKGSKTKRPGQAEAVVVQGQARAWGTAWTDYRPAGQPSFRAVQADAIVIDVGLCRPELARLGLRYVLSFDVLDAPCVVQQAVANPGGVHIARLRNSAAVEP